MNWKWYFKPQFSPLHSCVPVYAKDNDRYISMNIYLVIKILE